MYKFTNLCVRFWNGVRKLKTTTNSVVLETPNPLLEGLEVEDTSSPYQDTTLLLSRIESIESVEKYKICGHCAKRIIQVQGLLVNCDHCHHKLRASSCPTKLSASIVVKNERKKLNLCEIILFFYPMNFAISNMVISHDYDSEMSLTLYICICFESVCICIHMCTKGIVYFELCMAYIILNHLKMTGSPFIFFKFSNFGKFLRLTPFYRNKKACPKLKIQACKVDTPELLEDRPQ